MLPYSANQEPVWQRSLGAGGFVRHVRRRDLFRISKLIASAAVNYDQCGNESPTELLTSPSIAWWRDNNLRAVALISLYRRPVANLRLLAIAADEDVDIFSDQGLPMLEERLVQLDQHWLACYNPAPWLARRLAKAGYSLHSEVMGYAKDDLAHAEEGNARVEIRAAAADDVMSIMRIDAEAFEPFWRLNFPIVQAATRHSSYFLLAWDADIPVGYLMADIAGDAAYIGRIGVLGQYQGQHIGARLLHEGLKMMQRDGLSRATLNTQRTNAHSQALYERFGFAPSGEIEQVWAKDLS